MQASLLLLVLAGQPALSELAEVPQGFLEYLATMVEQDGEWVDPLTLRTNVAEEVPPADSEDGVTDRVETDSSEGEAMGDDSDE